MTETGNGRNDFIYDVRDYAAVGDGATLCTNAVQHAIDVCSAAGGGTVWVPPGRFVIGTIYLRSNVDLHLTNGAVLAGSTDIADYAADTHKNMYDGEPHMDRCLIYGRGVHSVAISGGGMIDGQGSREHFPNTGDPNRYRPMLIRLVECSRITIRDVSLVDPAAWTSAWLYCDDIVVDGINIRSRANSNGDGLDFDGCTDVRVSNSTFDNSDDSICLQTSRSDRPCRNVVVTNCVFSSRWAGMRIGLLSTGDFENVAVSNCVFHDITDSGLKIQLCEGGSMKNMVFSNLVMHNVPRPVFMTFNRQRAGVDSPDPVPPMRVMTEFWFNNIRVDSDSNDAGGGVESAFTFTGVPGKRIGCITLSNVSFTAPGGWRGSTDGTGDREAVGAMRASGRDLSLQPINVPELAEFSGPVLTDGVARFDDERTNVSPRWPEYDRLGHTVPASGVYARHVEELSIHQSRFAVREPDERPVIVCEDVAQPSVSGVRAACPPPEETRTTLRG